MLSEEMLNQIVEKFKEMSESNEEDSKNSSSPFTFIVFGVLLCYLISNKGGSLLGDAQPICPTTDMNNTMYGLPNVGALVYSKDNHEFGYIESITHTDTFSDITACVSFKDGEKHLSLESLKGSRYVVIR